MKKMKVIFYLKKEKTNAEGKSAIYGKILVGNTNATFATGKYISPERWEETNHLRNVVKKDEEIKSYLKFIEDKANAILLDFIKKDAVDVSADMVKSVLFGTSNISKGSQKTVLQAIDFHNAYFSKLVDGDKKADGTLDRYKCIRNITAEFIQKEYGCTDLPVYKMDKAFVFRLDSYLRTEKTYKDKVGCGNNTTVKYIRNLKTIFNYIIKQGGWIDFNPFLFYDVSLKPVKTTFLEEEELKTIEDYHFSCERLNTVKNIFLFSCYTAFAPVDAISLRWSNVINHTDGEKWIIAERTKTKIEANLPLLPPALRIIEQYKNDPRCANEGRLLPKLSNQKMNAYLKEIADICGINKNLTWYVARHTFATTVTLNHDVPLEIVSKMMGHSNTKQTQHYAKIQKKYISRHMQELKKMYV
ncbi:MAG: tyrosine-type recombinase/integrase [Bacteroidota bacterium]